MASLKALRAWWESASFPWRVWRVVAHVSAVDEVPIALPAKGVVLVVPSADPSWAAFDCPCRRGHRLLVNLNRAHRPFWKVSSGQPLSLYPSIDDRTTSRRCHFILRNGRIRWIREAYT